MVTFDNQALFNRFFCFIIFHVYTILQINDIAYVNLCISSFTSCLLFQRLRQNEINDSNSERPTRNKEMRLVKYSVPYFRDADGNVRSIFKAYNFYKL